MNRLPPKLFFARVPLAHLLGELWSLQARLTALTAVREFDGPSLVGETRRIAGDLAPLRDRLARLAGELPAAPDRSPIERARADIECILADYLGPAMSGLSATSELGEGPLRVFARASVECVLVDCLNPAILALTLLLVGDQENP